MKTGIMSGACRDTHGKRRAGDTVEFRIEVSGTGGKVVSVYGTGSNLTYTYFEGRYVG